MRLGLASALASSGALLSALAFLRVVRLGLASALASSGALLSALAFFRVVRLGLTLALASSGALLSAVVLAVGLEVVAAALGKRGINSKP